MRGRLAERSKFAEEFPCKHGTSYLQFDVFACKMRSQERKSIARRATFVFEFHQISRAASHPILERKRSRDGFNSSPLATIEKGVLLHSLFYCGARDGNRTRTVSHTPLKRARLPVPPLSHAAFINATLTLYTFLQKCQYLF